MLPALYFKLKIRGCRDGISAKMMEARHGLESNPFPISI